MAGLMFNGIDLKATYNFVVSSITGRESPPLEEKTLSLPYVNGEIVTEKKIKPRILTISGWLYDTTPDGVMQKKNDLVNLLTKSLNTPAKLKFPDTGREINVVLIDNPFVIENHAGAIFNAYAYQITLSFKANDPFFYGDEEQIQIIGVDKVTAYAPEVLDSPKHNLTTKDRTIKLQPYTILDHLGKYGLEGYGLQPNPNDYGLHDDGSNIFTVRQDDLPFTDVDYVFAVEEGTENLVINGGFETGDTTGWILSTDASISSLRSYNGNYSLRYNSTGSISAQNTATDYIPVSPNTTYTISAYLWNNFSQGRLTLDHIEYDASESILVDAVGKISPNGEQEWKKYSYTFTTNANTAYIKVRIVADYAPIGEAFADNIQLEEKPFATSFVDYADSPRADGKLVFPINGDISKFITRVLYKSPISISDLNTRILEFADTINASSVMNRLIIKTTGMSNNATIQIYEAVNSTTPVLKLEIENIDVTLWRDIVVILFDGNGYIYIDGILKGTWSIGITNNALKYFYITSTNPRNNYLDVTLLSNLYIGEYDPDVWTDEFIQELYNKQVLAKALKQVEKSATPPTALQNKYGISKMGQLLLQDSDLWNLWFSKETFSHKCVSAGYDWLEGE